MIRSGAGSLRAGVRILVLLVLCAGASAVSLDESPAEPGSWGFRPEEGQTAATNPPAFSWRPSPEASGYALQVAGDKDFSEVFLSLQNTPWSAYCPDAPFPPGTYHWRYAAIDAAGNATEWSLVRTFEVSAEAPELPKPTLETLLGRISEKHPRLFLRPEELPELRRVAQGDLAQHWQNILREADQLLAEPPDTTEPPKYPEGMTDRDGEWKKIWWGNRTRSIALTNGAATLAFAYLLSGEERYGIGARDLLMAFCAWDPKGSTQFDYNDEAALPLLYYPSRAYTWAYAALSEADRVRVQQVMAVRGADAFADLQRGNHLWTPYDSHDNRCWHMLGEVAIAFQGEIPDARKWLDYVTTIYFVCYPVWGVDSGGWSEGAAYWLSYLDRFMMWVLVSKSALDIDPFDKPFFHATGDFGLYTLPPGTEAGAWGDQGNLVSSQQVAPLMAKLAIGAQNPSWWWYAQQHKVELSQGYLDFLYSTRGRQLEERAPTDLPSSRAFKDVGVAVLNTNLLDGTKNVQIHFKSSPVGRHSHGYNANNAFMIYLNGKPAFTLTGRRDVSGSPHHKEWIWETKSDNAILVNGQGQLKHEWTARGHLSGFKTTEHFDFVSGEAADSYEGRLNRWTRRIFFFKPSLVILHDVLESPKPSTYQWLLHAVGPFEVGEQQADWKSERGEMHVRFLTPRALSITQTDQYSTPPGEWTKWKLNEWHLSAETEQPQEKMQFITAITIGPEQAAPELSSSGAGAVLEMAVEKRSYALTLSEEGFQLLGPDVEFAQP